MARNGNIIAEEVMKTSIPYQLHLLYGLAETMDIIRIAIDDQLRDIYWRFGKDTRKAPRGFGELDKRSLKNYLNAAKAMRIGFEKDMERMVQAATMDDNGKVDYEKYDTFLSDANFMARLFYYTMDRIVTTPDILERIKELPKGDKSLFPDELIERKFNLRQ